MLSLAQHRRHSRQCQRIAIRKSSVDFELAIKSRLQTEPNKLLDDMQKLLENIDIVADKFGSRAKDIPVESKTQFALGALDTIHNMIHAHLFGEKIA